MFVVHQHLPGEEPCLKSTYTPGEFSTCWPEVAQLFRESPSVLEVTLKSTWQGRENRMFTTFKRAE